MRIVAGTPRWAVLAALAVPHCVLPSAVYRIGLLPTGSTVENAYLIGLSAGSMGLALLTLGLVQPWGERLGGWVVPRRAAVGAAFTGASIVSLLCLYVLANSLFGFVERGPVLIGADQPPRPLPGGGVVALYLPLLAWGPLVFAVAGAYLRRRTDRATLALVG